MKTLHCSDLTFSSDTMGGGCIGLSWTCRPVWVVGIILATVPCMIYSTATPAAVGGKMYPRGNHWAVGHLMGKKSIERLPELQETISDYLNAPEGTRATELGRYKGLIEALMQQKTPKPTMPKTANRQFGLCSGRREEDGGKYPRESCIVRVCHTCFSWL